MDLNYQLLLYKQKCSRTLCHLLHIQDAVKGEGCLVVLLTYKGPSERFYHQNIARRCTREHLQNRLGVLSEVYSQIGCLSQQVPYIR